MIKNGDEPAAKKAKMDSVSNNYLMGMCNIYFLVQKKCEKTIKDLEDLIRNDKQKEQTNKGQK